MATHSSILAWKISRTKEPGRLPSMGLQTVRHDRVTNTYLLTYIHLYVYIYWRRKWQLTLVYLPRKSHGQSLSLVGYSPWGLKESDMTWQLSTCVHTAGYRSICVSVQSLSRVRLFVTPWTEAHQASLSITNSQSLLKLMSIELVMPANHLILQFVSVI